MPDVEERTLSRMRVTRIGWAHYSCSSESRPEANHTVDLVENGVLGSCTCEEFRFRLYPRWKQVNLPYPAFRCKHIQRVRDHEFDRILMHQIEVRNQQQNKPR